MDNSQFSISRYPLMKGSGVEWIGDIPDGWEDYRLKILVPNSINGAWGVDAQNDGNDIVCIRVADFDMDTFGVSEKKLTIRNIEPKQLETRLLEYGDVLIEKSGGGENQTVGRVVQNTIREKAVSSNFVGKLVVNHQKVNNRLLVYIFSSLYANRINTKSIKQTTGIQNLDISNYFNEKFPLSKSIDEQTTIANYLDRKTAEIDELIAQKERLLSLYEEEKTAIINQAVTKGIENEKLRMDNEGKIINSQLSTINYKDSGIDWLGEIPEHWGVKRLRYIGNCQNGVSQGADYFGSGLPFVSYKDVYRNLVLPEKVEGLAKSTETDRANYSVRKGDVFFTRTSETVEEIGLTSTCLVTIENAIFAGFLIRFRPFVGLLFEGFSKYYFRSQLHRLFFVKEMNMVTRASLSQDLLKKMPVIFPPMQEQKQIASHLDYEIKNINAKIAKTKKIIALQKEYRTALISEVVTGKIKVTQGMPS